MGIGCALLAFPGLADAAAKKPLLTATVDPRSSGRTVPEHFQGFSLEWPTVRIFAGSEAFGLNGPNMELIRLITNEGRSAPVLRIGGGSSDLTYWDPTGTAPRGPRRKIAVTPDMLRTLGSFADRTGMPLLPGVNLTEDEQNPIEMTQALVEGLPREKLMAVELGNEPELFPKFGARPEDWEFPDYVAEMQDLVDGLKAKHPDTVFAGPSALAGWRMNQTTLLRRLKGSLGMLTWHNYPLTTPTDTDGDKNIKQNPLNIGSIENLMSDRSTLSWASLWQPLVAEARKAKLPFRLTEVNSVSHGGMLKVSSTLAAALWVVDYQFAMAAIGAQGVNLTSTSPYYSPVFTGYDFEKQQWVVQPKPPMFGMWLFARAAPAGSKVLTAPIFKQTYDVKKPARVWATRDKDGTVRVVVLNRHDRSGIAEVRVPRVKGRTAKVERLTARKLDNIQGLTFAGQTLPVNTTTGKVTGRRRSERVTIGKGGKLRLKMPRGGAALVTLPGRYAGR